MRVVDLGCGTGDMTLELHRKLSARETVGIDSSKAMLEKAPRADGLRFEHGDIEQFAPAEPFDLVFSNAALHWVPDHPSLLKRLSQAAREQLAVQMPMNDEHASHQTAFEVAREQPFKRLLNGFEKRPALLQPEQYAAWLHRIGFARQNVRVQVYVHLLPERASVIEWVRGTLLTDYQKRLAPPDWERFLERYRELLLPKLADERPFFYTYQRLLFWGAR